MECLYKLQSIYISNVSTQYVYCEFIWGKLQYISIHYILNKIDFRAV